MFKNIVGFDHCSDPEAGAVKLSGLDLPNVLLLLFHPRTASLRTFGLEKSFASSTNRVSRRFHPRRALFFGRGHRRTTCSLLDLGRVRKRRQVQRPARHAASCLVLKGYIKIEGVTRFQDGAQGSKRKKQKAAFEHC